MGSILLNDLAAEQSLRPRTVRAYIQRMGIRPHLLRDPSRSNQLCNAITTDEAEQFRQWREDNGFTGKPVFPLSATA